MFGKFRYAGARVGWTTHLGLIELCPAERLCCAGLLSSNTAPTSLICSIMLHNVPLCLTRVRAECLTTSAHGPFTTPQLCPCR